MLTWSLIVGSLSHRHYPIALDRIPSTFDYGTVLFVSGAAMRRSRRIPLQLTLLALPVLTGRSPGPARDRPPMERGAER